MTMRIQIVARRRPHAFEVLPRRWVERTFVWISRHRRTVRDYERLPASHEAMITWAMIALMTRRLARHAPATPVSAPPRRQPHDGTPTGWRLRVRPAQVRDEEAGVVAVGPPGLTIQLWVSDGSAGRAWYQRLFGRPPDFTLFGDDTFCEWIFRPGHWEIHVVENDQPTPRQAPLRFGVEDIQAARDQVLGLGVEADDIEELRGVVRWCNFTDLWGNRLGLYQDLSRWP